MTNRQNELLIIASQPLSSDSYVQIISHLVQFIAVNNIGKKSQFYSDELILNMANTYELHGNNLKEVIEISYQK